MRRLPRRRRACRRRPHCPRPKQGHPQPSITCAITAAPPMVGGFGLHERNRPQARVPLRTRHSGMQRLRVHAQLVCDPRHLSDASSWVGPHLDRHPRGLRTQPIGHLRGRTTLKIVPGCRYLHQTRGKTRRPDSGSPALHPPALRRCAQGARSVEAAPRKAALWNTGLPAQRHPPHPRLKVAATTIATFPKVRHGPPDKPAPGGKP